MKKPFLAFFLVVYLSAVGPGYPGSQSFPRSRNGPIPDAKVLVVFVDSLRPDIVGEMVAKGRLPVIKKLFYDKGLRFSNFFSTFPSLTVSAYTCLITGKWPDQSGLKAQSLFERFPVRKKKLWKRMLFVPEDFPRFFNMLSKVEKAPEILKQNRTKTLYDYLGEKFHTSVVPVSPSVAPWAWPHMAANDVERIHRVVSEAADKVDDLNGKYALRYMVPDTRGRLFLVWFPEFDEDQHRHERGQFSEDAQKHMEAIDLWLGKVHEGFTRESNGQSPYVILFSDHGAYGCAGGIYNQPYYLARDFFYKTVKINIRGPDYVIDHPGTDVESYAYIDNMGRGQARVFLPVGDSLSENWSRPNTLYELTHYGLGPNRKPVDLIRGLLNIDLSARNKFPGEIDPHPVQLAFVKFSEDLIYVVRQGGAEALIHVKRNGKDLRYRYKPVRNVVQDKNGRLTYDETVSADPFGYLKHPKFRAQDPVKFIKEYHDDREWLEATYETDYPDAITALVRSFLWRPELLYLSKSQDPDICLSAAPGWNFRVEDINGADHGAILGDAFRSTLMISGPNIRRGVDAIPHRIIDVTPTLLQMIGFKGKADLDSVPIKGIYEDQ